MLFGLNMSVSLIQYIHNYITVVIFGRGQQKEVHMYINKEYFVEFWTDICGDDYLNVELASKIADVINLAYLAGKVDEKKCSGIE